MTNKYPNLRSHTRKRKSGRVITYYFYDRRRDGDTDIPLGTDYAQAVAKWEELRQGGPRIVGTLEEAFGAWEALEFSPFPCRNTVNHRLKIPRRKACRFDSGLGHQKPFWD